MPAPNDLPTLADIVAARERILGRVHRTPLATATSIGVMASPPVILYLKEEQRQKTGSFKARGALNRLANFTEAERARGLVTVSAGNHAAAVSWAAAAEGLAATVVMRKAAAPNKVEATRAYGATVDLFGENNVEAFDHVYELERERGLTFVPPFDDPYIIAGTGTVGLEVIDDLSAPDVVIVPVGGGGLISGVAPAIKERSPSTRVIGVEPESAQAMTEALRKGEPVSITEMNTIADGLAAPFAGKLNLLAVQRYVDGIVLVSDDEIRHAMRVLLERAKIMTEPAGAAAVAALLAGRVGQREGDRVVAVVSGANIDVPRLLSLLG
ncbi:MAG TPA: threonine/serine dehydratase [Ktedonobacterales bacterium]